MLLTKSCALYFILNKLNTNLKNQMFQLDNKYVVSFIKLSKNLKEIGLSFICSNIYINLQV